MRTPVEVINIALARLSVEPIVSMDEGTDRAARVKPIWAISLHLFLGESEWSFARVRKKPPRLSVDADTVRPFRFAYALPEDCLKLVDVHGLKGWSWLTSKYHPDYQVMLYDGGSKQAVLTDADDIQIDYVTSRVNLSYFPPDAIDALACRVAVEYALAKQNTSQRAQELMQFYEMAVAKAKKNDVKKEPPRRMAGHDYSIARL